MLRARILRLSCAALIVAGFSAQPAHAVSKEIIQLQTQVQQLQDAIARLQQSNDERMGVLKDLVQQSTDSINKMSIAVNGLEKRMQNQQDAITGKSDQVSGQVQALNDSVDELKARLAKMDKMLGDVQNQLQTANGALANMPQSTGSGGTTQPPANINPPANTNPPTAGATTPQEESGLPTSPAPLANGSGPSATTMYRTAYSDFMAANYPLATSEFGDLIKAYPDDNLSGNAYYYLGEIAFKGNKPSAAVRNYDHLLERYPDNPKIPAAHLHKGEALVQLKQREDGIRELRALIQRFPNSPEAAQARTRLNALNGGATRR
ncbi:MAG TPA: tetratricopeptide repeat protein [Acidobacteriaceae bacterium]|jgi:tol-pal system protein YbgF